MIGFPIMLPIHMQNISRSASMSGAGMSGGYSMAMEIGILIVSIGFFILVIAISFEVFLDAWKKIPRTSKITPVGKPETSDLSQDKITPVGKPETSDLSHDKPAYLVDVRLDAMQRDLDRIHCELKSLESRINNRKD